MATGIVHSMKAIPDTTQKPSQSKKKKKLEENYSGVL